MVEGRDIELIDLDHPNQPIASTRQNNYSSTNRVEQRFDNSRNHTKANQWIYEFMSDLTAFMYFYGNPMKHTIAINGDKRWDFLHKFIQFVSSLFQFASFVSCGIMFWVPSWTFAVENDQVDKNFENMVIKILITSLSIAVNIQLLKNLRKRKLRRKALQSLCDDRYLDIEDFDPVYIERLFFIVPLFKSKLETKCTRTMNIWIYIFLAIFSPGTILIPLIIILSITLGSSYPARNVIILFAVYNFVFIFLSIIYFILACMVIQLKLVGIESHAQYLIDGKIDSEVINEKKMPTHQDLKSLQER